MKGSSQSGAKKNAKNQPDGSTNYACENTKKNGTNWKFFCCRLQFGDQSSFVGAGPLSKSILVRVAWISTTRSEWLQRPSDFVAFT